MKILVTGGAGFIGQYVCEELARRAFEPVIFDHYNRGNYKYPVILGDITDASAVVEAFAHVHGFIHLAAVLGTQETIENPTPAAKTNVIGGLNILQAAAQYRVPGVYIGVGNHWMNNSYSISKTTVERFIDMYNRYRGTTINIVRAMNAYGPRQRAPMPYGDSKVKKITPTFVCKALNNEDIEIYGDGNQISDMVYVGDVATCLVLSLCHALRGEQLGVIEVGPEDNNTVNDVANLIINMSGSKSRLKHIAMRPGEIAGDTVSADVSTLNQIGINAADFVPLKTGLYNTIEYFKKILGKRD